MAAFSSSHAVIGLGFNEYELQTSCQPKYRLPRQESMAVPRGRHRTTFTVRSRPRKVAATRLSVQNSSMPTADSVRVRMSGDDAHSAASLQMNNSNAKQTGIPTELGARLEDEGRPKLLRKLSEANQYIRHLQHELRDKEEALLETASQLSAMEMELQALVYVAQEISRQGIKPGTRKINGRYIHSHLAARLEEMQKLLHERIKDADQVRTWSIDLVYYGMAEDVQVMGSFDGWTRGEQMSPESTGTFTKFTTAIKLRPGRYEIKFLVDGAWHLSPDLPTVGEGLTMNNLLLVDRF